MADSQKLLYIVVVDGGERGGEEGDLNERSSFRYSRSVLQSTLQLMGCKARHAFKMSRRVFEVMRDEHSYSMELDSKHVNKENTDSNITMQFELYKRKTTVIVSREKFLNIICDALSAYKYVGPNQRADLLLACRIRERKESVTILLCGTSGCGKSTLSALLGSRLGITTIVSTDSIRHMMRSFVDERENPLLWASTYHAGECLDPVAVAKAKARCKAKKLSLSSSNPSSREGSDVDPVNTNSSELSISKKQLAIEGYKAQSEMVMDSLDRLITAWEERNESVVVEGVHLSLNFVMGLMKKHPSIIPFMIHISSEDKHMERFAVRAKYMTLDPAKNKYIKYIRNIRAIQDYLVIRADKHLIPRINNTNVDRSVAAIHATVFSCLRRCSTGEILLDPATNTLPLLDEEYRKQCSANSLSSKGMFQIIQRKGSSRNLMALVKTDGSVAKAWPVRSISSLNRGEKSVGDPVYGPLNVGKGEPVNLRFGGFGISEWPSDTGGANHNGSVDESRADCLETGYSSSPNSKEVKEELSVSSSEEEADDVPASADTDDDVSGDDDNVSSRGTLNDEMEGSVDEESTKSDEEYEDLAMHDDNSQNGYWSDNDVGPTDPTAALSESKKLIDTDNNNSSDSNNNSDMKMRKRSSSDSLRLRRHSQNVRTVSKSVSLLLYRGSALSVSPQD